MLDSILVEFYTNISRRKNPDEIKRGLKKGNYSPRLIDAGNYSPRLTDTGLTGFLTANLCLTVKELTNHKKKFHLN